MTATKGESQNASRVLRLFMDRSDDRIREFLNLVGTQVRDWLVREFSTTLTREEVDEAHIEALVGIAKGTPKARSDRQLIAWFRVTAWNKAIDQCRKKARRGRRVQYSSDIETLAIHIAAADDQLLRSELREFLWQAILGLPGIQREVMRADVLLDRQLSDEQLAQMLGCTANAVTSARDRAGKALRKRLVSYVNCH